MTTTYTNEDGHFVACQDNDTVYTVELVGNIYMALPVLAKNCDPDLYYFGTRWEAQKEANDASEQARGWGY